MQVNNNFNLNTTHPAVITNSYAQSDYRSAHDILADNSHELSILAEEVGINWQTASEQIHSFPCTISNPSIASERKYRGKVVVFAKINRTKNGREYPVITCYTHKHGGISNTWNGYTAEHGDSLPYKPAYISTPVTTFSAEPKQAQDVATEQYKINRFNAFHQHFQTLPKATESIYFDRKQISLSQLPESFDLRHDTDARGHYVVFAVCNRKHKTVGYQKIYDYAFQDRIGDTPRDKDFVFLPNSKKGSCAVIGKITGKRIDIAEGLATAITSYLATGIPCAVALDANSLQHIVKRFKGLKIRIIADNDMTSNKGNVGLYAALKLAYSDKVKVVMPQLANQKCDFNDVLVAKNINQVKRQINSNKVFSKLSAAQYHLEAIKYVPQPQLKKVFNAACFHIAQNSATPQEYRQHCTRLIRALKGREGIQKGCVQATVKRMFDRCMLKKIKQRHSVTNLEGVDVFDSTGMTNVQIAHRIINQMKKGKITIDMRGMGTGKTEVMAIVAAYFKSQAVNENRISYVNPRVSLSQSGAKRLGLDFYKDIDLMTSRSEQISICINSIPRYDISDNNLFLGDEFRQMIEFLSVGSVKDREMVQAALIEAINNAETVILADADFNDYTLDWIKQNTNKSIELITADSVKHHKVITVVKDIETLLTGAGEKIKQGHNIWITTDSKVQANKSVVSMELLDDLLGEINLLAEDILIITSDNKGDPKQAAFLQNPNDESLKYRLVICTPVISSGVSVTHDHFASVYGLFTNVIPANEMLQSIGRVRAAKDIQVTFKKNFQQHRETNKANLLNGNELKVIQYLGKGQYEVSQFGQQQIDVRADINESLNNFDREFLILAQLKSYTVTTSQRSEQIEELSTLSTERNINRVMNAEPIDQPTLQQLKRNKPATQAASDSLERALVQEMAGKTYDELDKEDVSFYNRQGLNVIENYELYHSEMADIRAQELQAHEDNNGETNGSTSRKFFIDEIVKRVSVDEFTANDTDDLMAFLQANQDELYANRLGNFKYIDRPIVKLKNLLAKIGYVIEESRRDAYQRYYTVQVNEQVLGYVKQRGLVTLRK